MKTFREIVNEETRGRRGMPIDLWVIQVWQRVAGELDKREAAMIQLISEATDPVDPGMQSATNAAAWYDRRRDFLARRQLNPSAFNGFAVTVQCGVCGVRHHDQYEHCERKDCPVWQDKRTEA